VNAAVQAAGLKQLEKWSETRRIRCLTRNTRVRHYKSSHGRGIGEYRAIDGVVRIARGWLGPESISIRKPVAPVRGRGQEQDIPEHRPEQEGTMTPYYVRAQKVRT